MELLNTKPAVKDMMGDLGGITLFFFNEVFVFVTNFCISEAVVD